MKSSLIQTDKGPIEVSRIGTGIPILFIHGGHFNSKISLFNKGFDLQKFCLITPSRPGYGETPLTKENKTPKGTADLIIALLNKLGINKTNLIGISAGGLTAIELAANYPERIDKLILMSALTSNWVLPKSYIYKFSKILFAPGIEKYMWWMYRKMYVLVPHFMAKLMFVELSDYRPISFTNTETIELRAMINKMRSKQGFVNDLDQRIEENLIEKIISETLILHSNFDHTVSLMHPRNANKKIKNSQFITYNNRWGHILWLGDESKEPLADTLSFLNKR